MATTQLLTVGAMLDALAEAAVARDVPEAVAAEARRATSRRLGMSRHAPAEPATQRRAEAYFSAVVRRLSVRRNGSPRAAARFVVASVVEDLRAAGRDGHAIWGELERGWNDRIPADVLEEYRVRLCG